VREILAVNGSIPDNPTIVSLDGNLFSSPYGIGLDGRGNIFVSAFGFFSDPTTVFVLEIPRSQPPALSFASTPVGKTSSDSPQSVQIQNIGNANLTETSHSVSPNWDQVAGSGTPEDCTDGFSLDPAAECNLSISFKPAETGPLTGAVTIVDDSLNAPGSTQSIPLSDTGAGPHITSLNWTYGAPYSVVILNGTNFGATQGSSTVTFNRIPTPHYYWADTKIYVTVPPSASTGNLMVTVGGQVSNAIPFTVVPMPMVTGISPASGPVGTLVIISGKNLLDFENRGTVTFNGKSLPIMSQSSTAIEVAIPAGGVTGDFHVLVNDTGMNTSTFTVTP
jgi:hypothetical protein